MNADPIRRADLRGAQTLRLTSDVLATTRPFRMVIESCAVSGRHGHRYKEHLGTGLACRPDQVSRRLVEWMACLRDRVAPLAKLCFVECLQLCEIVSPPELIGG